MTPDAIARRAIPLLDLTNLDDTCTIEVIDALLRRAVTPAGAVAAVCVWPQFVHHCARALHGGPVRIATVVNFPKGGDNIERAIDDTRQTIADGAHEVDLVLPYRAFLQGDLATCSQMVRAVADVCAPSHTTLKVILESGAFADAASIAEASRLAIRNGANFIKTSTGKSAISATPEAAEAMIEAIRDSGAAVGFKASGGIRSVADAAAYLAIADRLMGSDWVSPRTFRFGASGLLDALLAATKP